jgi:hypothetical protein
MCDAETVRPEGVIPFAMARGMTTWISGQDYDRVQAAGPWRPHVLAHTTYAIADMYKTHPETGRRYRGTVSLHRFIIGDPPGLTVDHRNRDGLSNWRENLVAVPHGVNLSNRETGRGASGFWGVDLHRGRYRARVTVCAPGEDAQRRFLGYYDTPELAARERDRAMLAYYGPYVPLNYPADEYGYELPVTVKPAEIPF